MQWSRQSDEETIRRQERYRQSGVRGLWLFGQASFPVSEAFAAARVLDTLRGFMAVLAGPGSAQRLPMAEFLDVAFGGRLRFRLPLGVEARVTLHSDRLFCWACKAKTEVLAGVDVQTGPHKASLRMPALG